MARARDVQGFSSDSHPHRVGLLLGGIALVVVALVVVVVALAVDVSRNGSSVRLTAAKDKTLTTTTRVVTSTTTGRVETATTSTLTTTTSVGATSTTLASGVVPNLLGDPVRQAKTELQALGFEYRTTAVQSSGSFPPPGSVISEQPVVGSSAPAGSVIALGVARLGTTSGSTTTTTTQVFPKGSTTTSTTLPPCRSGTVTIVEESDVQPSPVCLTLGSKLVVSETNGSSGSDVWMGSPLTKDASVLEALGNAPVNGMTSTQFEAVGTGQTDVDSESEAPCAIAAGSAPPCSLPDFQNTLVVQVVQ